MGRNLVGGNGRTLVSRQPRRRQNFLHHGSLGLAVFIDVGRSDAGLPLHGGVLVAQGRIGAKNIADRQVVT